MKAYGQKILIFLFVSLVAGVIVLSAGGGSLEPNAPPGPTMHTLDEIYAAVTGGEEPPEPFAVDMFLKIEGVPGESQDSRHKDWIEVLSYSHGMVQPTGGIGAIEHQDFSITKCIDKATPKLALYCCSRTQVAEAVLELCGPDVNEPPVYTTYLTDVVITSVRPNGSVTSSDPLPMEEVTMNYGSIEWQYVAADGNTILAGWDVNTDTPIDPCGYITPDVP
jgi:type VI secretion system secreted protein Hcp